MDFLIGTPRSGSGPASMNGPSRVIQTGLMETAERLRAQGVTVPPLAGKLLRPVVACALVPPTLRASLDQRFWSGALAVQMIHEASLLHDDILDDARERRGERTLVASRGPGPALVLGDLYLTGAYRAAAETKSFEFMELFARAVERTVVGEILQAERAGRRLTEDTYLEIVTKKSGELFGAAAVLGGLLLDLGRIDERRSLGRELGTLYQRVDDLLDYCPTADTGKPPLQDFKQRKWTWTLDLVGLDRFEVGEEEVLGALHGAADAGPSPAMRGLELLRREGERLVAQAAELSSGDTLIADVVEAWVRAAEQGVGRQAARGTGAPRKVEASRNETLRAGQAAEVAAAACELGSPADWPEYFGRHAKTFRFASRLFPAPAFRSITGVYTFCRFTDDLVDEPWDDADPDVVSERLEAWSDLSRAAFSGRATGIPLLDDVMGEASRAGVDPFHLEALLEGVKMDLSRHEYEDWSDLERYTFGVAGAVGGWITQLFGTRDPFVLERAYDLGHAMQLTNIVRDVGEDLDRGRLYIPRALLAKYDLSRDELVSVRHGDGPLPHGYPGLMEEMMAVADRRYEEAWPGIRRLPPWFARPTAVAAGAYRAIHEAVRRNDHDTLRVRASTSLSAKVVHGGGAVLRSMSAVPGWVRHGRERTKPHGSLARGEAS
jgi:phytoene synthase